MNIIHVVLILAGPLKAAPVKASPALTAAQCKEKSGHIVSGLRKHCENNEVKYGSVTGYKCACFCCGPDAAERAFFISIPAADKKKYAGVQSAKDWKNPYLVVHAMGVELVGGEQVQMDDLERTLAAIPLSSWPYGRVVAVQQTGINSPTFEKQIQENVKKVLNILKELGISAESWPSA